MCFGFPTGILNDRVFLYWNVTWWFNLRFQPSGGTIEGVFMGLDIQLKSHENPTKIEIGILSRGYEGAKERLGYPYSLFPIKLGATWRYFEFPIE